MSNLGLWSKFNGGKTVSLAQVVEETKADGIMIGMEQFLSLINHTLRHFA
jgi:hypothetical protein